MAYVPVDVLVAGQPIHDGINSVPDRMGILRTLTKMPKYASSVTKIP